MDKKILIQAGSILGVFLVLIIAAVGCTRANPAPTVAAITNGDEVYLRLDGGITVTNEEIFETMMNVEGLDYLLRYVDEIILAEFYSTITQDDIDRELMLAVFGTDDEEILTELQGPDGIYDEYLASFYDNLEVLGYDTSDPAEIAVFLKAEIAKKNLTKHKINSDVYGGNYFVYDTEIENYYNTTVKNDVCALPIMFSSVNEVEAVFSEFNLVLNKNAGIGLYTEDATIPFEDVSSEDFIIGENTTQLTKAEVFPYYVAIYNYMNPFAEQLPLDISQEDLCTDYPEIAVFSYEDMTTGLKTGSTSSIYAEYLFNTLDLENEDVVTFSYLPKAFDTKQVFTFKISQEVTTAFADLTDAEKLVYRNEFIETILSDELMDYAVAELRLESDFDIIDPYLSLAYLAENGLETDGSGSETLLATLGDLDITADMLFDYMVNRAGIFYSLEVSKIKMMLESDLFQDIYGTDPNYLTSNKGNLPLFRDNLGIIKSNFGKNYYADSGLPSTIYSWNDVLFLGFGARTQSEVLMQDVVESLQADMIHPTIDFDSYKDYMEMQANEYFNLDVEHLLLFVDFDNDFVSDDFSEFIETLDQVPADKAEYLALKSEYEGIVNTKLNNEMTFAEIVTEYNDTLIGDTESEWYNIKQYGFLLMTEELSAKQSISYVNSDDLDDAFRAMLKTLYDEYTNPVNLDLEHLLASELTTTDFGVHLIDAFKGDNFEQPSAVYVIDPDNPDAYSAGADNADLIPTEAQLELYNLMRLAEQKGERTDVKLPGSVFTAISAYYDTVLNAYYNQTGYSIVGIEYVLDSNPVFTTDADASLAKVNTILDILYSANFPDEFVIPE